MSENLEAFILAGYGTVGMVAGVVQGVENVVNGEGSFGDGFDEGVNAWVERGEAAAEQYGDNVIGEVIVDIVVGIGGTDYSTR
jgi:hypothetical protein